MKDALFQLWHFLSDNSWYDSYSKNMRSYLFSGFFTLSGFLLSAHTFIVIHMKKEIYDSNKYKQRVSKLREINPDHSHYGALTRLSRLLIGSVGMALITSICQFTFGLIGVNWAVLICTGMAAITAVALLVSLHAIRDNIKVWLQDIEEDAKAKPTTRPTETPAAKP